MKKIIFLLILGGLFAGWWFFIRKDDSDAIRYQTAAITHGEIIQAVTATGTLNPVLKVQVGSQVSGIILKLYADYNSEVKSGEVIGELDPATYQANLAQAEAELASSQAQLNLAELNTKRQRDLTEQKIGTQADLDSAEAALKQAQATILTRQAQVQKAKVDLGRCTIYAPIDGIVISRPVDVGQTVAASLSAPIMFNIANDLRKMQIEASIAEADVGNIEKGQDVSFAVDAYQYRTFHGKVQLVRNEAITVQSVVTYVAIIEVSNEDLKLKPGMTANVSVEISKRDDALKLPNGALRFRPADAPPTMAKTEGAGPSGERRQRGPGAGGPTAGNAGSPAGTPAAPAGGSSEPRVADATAVPKPEGAADATPPRTGPPGEGGPRRREGRGAGGGGPRRDRGGPLSRNVYKLVDGKPVAVPVKLGISDGIFTEIIEGLKADDQIITGAFTPQASPTAGAPSNPFGGGGNRGGGGGGRRF